MDNKERQAKHPKYSLFTAIALIIGIVIGSGIFFKTDDILYYTGGNVLLGIISFIIAAISIIFGSLTIATLSRRCSGMGGLIDYAEKFINRRLACVIGFFQLFLYFPTLIVVVSWISGVYTCLLFNIQENLLVQLLIGFVFMFILFLQNIFFPKIGGYFQNASMIVKLIPLIVLSAIGIIFFEPASVNKGELSLIISNSSWLMAVVPIAFSFDGWMISTTMAHDIKNSKKNLPIALTISPIIILVIYILYFFGISSLLSTREIISLGNTHVYVIANNLFGHYGSKIILSFIIISVLGTVNGLIMGVIRMPTTLSSKGLFPYKKLFEKETDKGISIPSAIFSLFIVLFWYLVHFIVQNFSILKSSDISEISIVFNYAFYIFLYIAVIKLFFKKEIGIFNGIIFPVLAIIGSIIIIIGGFINPIALYFLIICLILIISSLLYYNFINRKGIRK